MPDLCNIVPKHIEFHDDYIRIFLPRNKTDKYREGNYVYSASSSKYCHVGVLRGGGHWGFRFCGFGKFLIRFFRFRS